MFAATACAGSGVFAEDAAPVCTSAGVQYKVGEYACIPACHGRRRLARCDVLADTASWTYVLDACPSAMINRPWPGEWTALPVVAAMTPLPVSVNMSAPTPAIQMRIAGHSSLFR